MWRKIKLQRESLYVGDNHHQFTLLTGFSFTPNHWKGRHRLPIWSNDMKKLKSSQKAMAFSIVNKFCEKLLHTFDYIYGI